MNLSIFKNLVTSRFLLPAVTLALLAGAAGAQTAKLPADYLSEAVNHAWFYPSLREAETYFTNLKEGGVYETPLVVRFGLSMRGLVPAGKVAGRAGHHHLLINQTLPSDSNKSLPFSDKYIHFGKGQMEMVANLPPGPHVFRLLLANQEHIPYFVYSKPLHITVSKQNTDLTPASVQGPPRVELLSPADRATVTPPFRVQFHASGYNVSHKLPGVAGTGHFRLTMERAGRKPEVLSFTGGETETWLNPPAGDYTMRLELVSNTVIGKVIDSSGSSALSVVAR